MKIAILGASASAQVKNHKTGEITGYSEVLRLCLLAEGTVKPENFKRFTYPGNRASDGGLLQLQAVVNYQPDICLFEPLIEDRSRGISVKDDQIAYIYATLIEAGILPVSLFLPIPENRIPERGPDFMRFNSFCQTYGLPVIRVDLSNLDDIEKYCQGLHTKPLGANIYANQIMETLRELDNPRVILSRLKKIPHTSTLPVVISMMTSSGGIPSESGFNFIIQPKTSTTRSAQLIQAQKIGPFSPVLNVTAQTLNQDLSQKIGTPIHRKISVWDPYCHYERDSYVTLANIQLDGKNPVYVEVCPSQDDPNYVSCRSDFSDWPESSKRALKPAGRPFLITDGPVSFSPISRGSGKYVSSKHEA